MNFGGYFFSLLLHAALFAVILFWPSAPPIKLDQPMIQISLNIGAPGGEALPSPVLGSLPAPGISGTPKATEAIPKAPEKTPQAEALPAPKQTEPASPPPDAKNIPDIAKQLPTAEKKPEPVPEQQADAKPIPAAIPRTPEPTPKPEPAPKPTNKPVPKTEPKPAPKPLPAQDKKSGSKTSQDKKTAQPASPSSEDVMKAALANAQAKVKAEENSILSNALASARRDSRKHSVGGGGGEGDGPGGGGLYDVYAGQVILAVRPNWSMPTYSRETLVAHVRVILDAQGNVLEARLEKGSPRADFNASTVNAVLRTKKLPPPPTPEQRDIVIVFNSLELMGK